MSDEQNYDPNDPIDRLKCHYSGDAYDATTNPGGMGEGGHRLNFAPALVDVATVAQEAGEQIDAANLPDIVARSDEFRAAFLGALENEPDFDGNGQPVSEGQWYYDKNLNRARVRGASNWGDLAAIASDYVPDGGGTFSGAVTFNGDVDFTAGLTGTLSGNASSATELQNERTIGVVDGGGITGASTTFNGTDDVLLGLTVDDDGHTHSFGNLGLGSIASHDADNVNISGGALAGVSIDSAPIGETTRSSAKVTTFDANGAADLGDTLDVTGATTLQSTLGVTGLATLSGGVKTDEITGNSGAIVIDAPSGQSVEIKVGGSKKAEIAPDGDVVAEGRLFAGAVDVAEYTITSVPSSGAFKGTNMSQGYLEGLTFTSGSGRFTVQHAGTYRVSLHLAAAGSSHSPEGAIYKYPAGGGAVQASRQGSSSGTGMNTDITMIAACAVGEYFEIHNLASAAAIGTDDNESWVVIERL